MSSYAALFEQSSSSSSATPLAFSRVSDLPGIDLAAFAQTPGPSVPVESSSEDDGQKSKCKCDENPKSTGRNLVVCIDGTANQFSLQNTHVVELYSRLEKNEHQLTYYNSGIGTFVEESNYFARMKQRIAHTIDMAVAYNLKRIVLSAYLWLSDNYQPGDRIYLFGFSRGAYQVRIIAGMIEKVGLLHKGNTDQIPFAYELYVADTANRDRNHTSPSSDGVDAGRERITNTKDPRYTSELCKQFKRTLSHKNVTVHFVGAWDTVSSVGVTRKPTLPETTNGMIHVCIFRHALSLDELRVKFLPEYANGGAGPNIFGGGNIKEVWFVGSHSDIGGGNTANLALDTFGPSLRWMLYEAMEHGLRVEPFQGGWGPAKHNPSMGPIWRVLEVLPARRLSYREPYPNSTRRWKPHLFDGRHVQRGQLIHHSVLEYQKSHPDYVPKAQLYAGQSWKDIWSGLHDENLIERDLYLQILPEVLNAIQICIAEGKPLSDRVLNTLNELCASAAGRQAISDSPGVATQLFTMVQEVNTVRLQRLADRTRLLDALATTLAVFDTLPSQCSAYSVLDLQVWFLGVTENFKKSVSHIIDVFAVEANVTGGAVNENSLAPTFIDGLATWTETTEGQENIVHSAHASAIASSLLNALRLNSDAADDNIPEKSRAHTCLSIAKVLSVFDSRPVGCDGQPYVDIARWLRFVPPSKCVRIIRLFGNTEATNAESVIYAQLSNNLVSMLQAREYASNLPSDYMWNALDDLPTYNVGRQVLVETPNLTGTLFNILERTSVAIAQPSPVRARVLAILARALACYDSIPTDGPLIANAQLRRWFSGAPEDCVPHVFHITNVFGIKSYLSSCVQSSDFLSEECAERLTALVSSSSGVQHLTDSSNAADVVDMLLCALRLNSRSSLELSTSEMQTRIVTALAACLSAFKSRPFDCEWYSIIELAWWLRYVTADLRHDLLGRYARSDLIPTEFSCYDQLTSQVIMDLTNALESDFSPQGSVWELLQAIGSSCSSLHCNAARVSTHLITQALGRQAISCSPDAAHALFDALLKASGRASHSLYFTSRALNAIGQALTTFRQSPDTSCLYSAFDIQTWLAGMSDDIVARVVETFSLESHLRKMANESLPMTPDVRGRIMELWSYPDGFRSLIASPRCGDTVDAILTVIRLTNNVDAEQYHSSDTETRIRITDCLCGVLVNFSSPPDGWRRRSFKELSWLPRSAAPEDCNTIISVFGPKEKVLYGHTETVCSVAYSPEGRYIASGSYDYTVRLWDAETGHPVGEPIKDHRSWVHSVAFSPNGTLLVSGSEDRTFRIWDVATQQAVGLPLTKHGDLVLSVAFSPDGKKIVSGLIENTIWIWDWETGLPMGEPLHGHTGMVYSVMFSPDGSHICSGANDDTVRIWNTTTHEMVRVLNGHSGPVYSAVFTPDGKRIVSGSEDNTIRVWDAESGETVLGPLRGHIYSVFAVAVSPDGKRIVSGSKDATVRLWDAATGEAVGEPLRGHTDWVRSVAISPDGRRIVSGSLDNTLMIWDMDVSDDDVSRPS